MPSSRKRIGFLPSEEVQIIIEKICKDKNLSQSKVTGILVEEALKNRGALNSALNIGYDLDMDLKRITPHLIIQWRVIIIIILGKIILAMILK